MKGTKTFNKNLNVMVTGDVYDLVAKIAKDQGLRRQEYIRTLVGWAATNNVKLTPDQPPNLEVQHAK